MKKTLSSILFLFIAILGLAQDEPVKKTAKPNIPGTFMIDLGLNQAINRPDTWDQAAWGSRTVNIYYQYSMRFGRSKFSFNPGIGLSMERWKFKNNATLIDTVELVSYPGGAAAPDQVEQYNLLSPTRIYPELAEKSQLIANYVEMPLEFRFDTSPEDISRSFNVAIGGRIGWLFDSKTKVKYQEDDGDIVKVKNKKVYGLEQFRYGIYTRIGLGGFNLFTFYNLSPVFQKGKGPLGQDFTSITFGISVNGF